MSERTTSSSYANPSPYGWVSTDDDANSNNNNATSNVNATSEEEEDNNKNPFNLRLWDPMQMAESSSSTAAIPTCEFPGAAAFPFGFTLDDIRDEMAVVGFFGPIRPGSSLPHPMRALNAFSNGLFLHYGKWPFREFRDRLFILVKGYYD